MWSEQATWVALAMLMMPGLSPWNAEAAMRQGYRQRVERLDEQPGADGDEAGETSSNKFHGKPLGDADGRQ